MAAPDEGTLNHWLLYLSAARSNIDPPNCPRTLKHFLNSRSKLCELASPRNAAIMKLLGYRGMPNEDEDDEEDVVEGGGGAGAAAAEGENEDEEDVAEGGDSADAAAAAGEEELAAEAVATAAAAGIGSSSCSVSHASESSVVLPLNVLSQREGDTRTH